MKIKKLFLIVVLGFGLSALMSTTCKKDDPDNPDTCQGNTSATASGYLNSSFCFDVLVTNEYDSNGELSFVTRQSGDTEYAFSFKIYDFQGTKTYNCGPDQDGYAELIVHGSDNEFYKAQSGTVTITEVSETSLKANFSFVCKGYYNKESVNLSGNVDF
jgi:hypothetical protein